MSGRRLISGLVTMGLALIASVLSVTVANAAPAPAQQYCYTEVAPIAPGSRELGFVSRTCSSTAAANSVLPAEAASAAAAQTLLVTVFQDQDYGGSYDTLGGNFGTCDSSGYGFSDTSLSNFYANGISSYKLNGACNRSTIYTNTGYGGTARSFTGQNIRFVGATHNDDVLSMRVRKG